MSDKWHKLTKEQAREFLSSKGDKKIREHNFSKRILHWPYCKYCGLVALKNDVTRKAMRKKCVTYE